MKSAKLILLFMASGILSGAHGADQDLDYRKLSPTCRSCNEFEAIVVKQNTELSPDTRLEYALKIAKLIEKISLKGKSELEQRREIYYAINATIQVLDDDFDSETSVQLLDLRTKAPKTFDYVLWRFPLASQQNIIERMRSFKEDNIRPKAVIPEAKAIEP